MNRGFIPWSNAIAGATNALMQVFGRTPSRSAKAHADRAQIGDPLPGVLGELKAYASGDGGCESGGGVIPGVWIRGGCVIPITFCCVKNPVWKCCMSLACPRLVGVFSEDAFGLAPGELYKPGAGAWLAVDDTGLGE